MSSYNPYKRYLDELYFNMLEYFNFEKEFTNNLSKNYISNYVICLTDADEIEAWKSKNKYDYCLDFFENCDNIGFDKFQVELINQNQNEKNKKLKTYETLDEVCHSLKKGGRISIIGNQFLCYMNKITYTRKCFKCYIKNNQLIIYFGEGKSLFIPKFFPDKILDSENVYIVDLSCDKTCLIEAIFDNNNRYQNMYESIKSFGSKYEQNNKMSMTNLLSYDINKNELKKFKTYNFYLNEEEKNNENYENKNTYQQDNNININNVYINYENNYIDKNDNNNNNIIYNYNNDYYINYEENEIKTNIEPNNNYIYINNDQQYININEYPRDSNENINNIEINNKYIYNQNEIPEEEIKEKDEQNNYIEIENQEKEKEKEILNKKEEKEKDNYIDTESQNQIDQEKATFYINYTHNQKLNPELKDISISNLSKSNNNIIDEEEKEKEFNIKEIQNFPTLGLDNINGKNSYINSSLQCLINTKPLIDFFLEGKNINKIPEENGDIKLLPSFLQIMKKAWTNNDINIKSINPEKFINNLKQISSSFNNEEENNIGELIIFLLEQIYGEVQTYNEYKEDNREIIYNSFFGGKKELISECLNCLNNIENNNEENDIKKIIEIKDLYYLFFRLNDVFEFIKDNKAKEMKNINIYDCLNYFEKPNIVEQNGKICEKCGNKEKFFVTSKISKCQNNLLILLNKNFNNEDNDEIKFELNENLDMKTYIKDNELNENLNYYLYAIICLNISFEENKNKIHHVAFCKSLVDNKWYKYDDNIIELITNLQNEVDKLRMPVALFYQKFD